MRIVVSLDDAIARYAGRLAAFPAQAQRAFVEGLNEGGDKQRTETRHDLRDQMGVSRYGAITSRTTTIRAGAGRLEYKIKGVGKGLPIREFPVRAAPHRPVTARPWNVGHTFARSFMTSKRGLLLARRGGSRFPVRALYGPSVAKEIVKDRTAADFEAHSARHVEAAVIKRLGRMLP